MHVISVRVSIKNWTCVTTNKFILNSSCNVWKVCNHNASQDVQKNGVTKHNLIHEVWPRNKTLYNSLYESKRYFLKKLISVIIWKRFTSLL